MSLTFEEYQRESRKTAQYPSPGGLGFVYPALGLAGEAGEVAEKVKKIIRDKAGRLDDTTRAALSKELGDVLWYAAQLATELQLDLGKIAEENLRKVFSRLERGKIQGEGDDR